MSKVHKALESLRPRDWAEIPQGDDLKTFLHETFTEAELIAASVPQQPGGSPYGECSISPHIHEPNAAHRASEIVASAARAPDPQIEDVASLQKGWGKPIKLSPKDNPLGMSVWKMAGHDRHGAWFARRSVHEGLGFTKWKKAMQREFAESLAVDGGPGEGSIRGIGADRRLERRTVEGVGQMDVYQLSAQFPGPVAPREFITCLLTTENGLSEKSVAPGAKHAPRHYMVVSIPVDHPDVPVTQALVRGHYESVEMIREIPIAEPKSRSVPNLLGSKAEKREGSRSRGLTVPAGDSDTHSERTELHSHSNDEPEMNPVEWIMITRSDPGGGIPRFMVERGTPGSIAADAVKFLDWATGQEEVADESADAEKQEAVQEKVKERQASATYNAVEGNGHLAGVAPVNANTSMTGAFEPSQPGESGFIAGLTSAVRSYAPNAVQSRLGMGSPDGAEEDDDNTSSSSDDSFDSFPEYNDYQTAYEGPRTPDPLASESSFSLPPGDGNGEVEGFEQSHDQRHYEREIKKLSERRRTLDERMQKSEESDQKKREELKTKEEKEQDKARERLDKEKRKQEDRHKKEMEKLEQKKAKEERRLEDKKRKARDKDVGARDRREKDEYKRRVELLQRENELLRRQLGDLQKENTLLVQTVGKLGEGPVALRQVRDEIARSSGELGRVRSSSQASRKSGLSGGTRASKRSDESGKTGGLLGVGGGGGGGENLEVPGGFASSGSSRETSQEVAGEKA